MPKPSKPSETGASEALPAEMTPEALVTRAEAAGFRLTESAGGKLYVSPVGPVGHLHPELRAALEATKDDVLHYLRYCQEWPRFDPERRKRISDEIEVMLQARKRDPAEAYAIVDELERVVLFYAPKPKHAPPPVVPADRDWPLPARVGEQAHALLKALEGCDPELLQLTVGGEIVWERAPLALEGRRVLRSPWIETLARLAEPPRGAGHPKLDENRLALERGVLSVLEHADLPRPARVLAEVIAYAFPGEEPATPDAERVALARAVKRCGLNK